MRASGRGRSDFPSEAAARGRAVAESGLQDALAYLENPDELDASRPQVMAHLAEQVRAALAALNHGLPVQHRSVTSPVPADELAVLEQVDQLLTMVIVQTSTTALHGPQADLQACIR